MIPPLLLYSEALHLGDVFHAYAENCTFMGIDDIYFEDYEPCIKLSNGISIIHTGGGVWYRKDGQLFRTYQQAIYDYTKDPTPSGV